MVVRKGQPEVRIAGSKLPDIPLPTNCSGNGTTYASAVTTSGSAPTPGSP